MTRALRTSAPSCGVEREGDVEAVGRQEAGGAIGPFQQHHGAIGQIVEAELGKLGRAREPVEIGMNEREARKLVGLHQGEGRARHLDRIVAGEIADERAREGGLAGAEIARTASPDRRARARRRYRCAKRTVACSFGNVTVKLAPPAAVGNIAALRLEAYTVRHYAPLFATRSVSEQTERPLFGIMRMR